MSEKQLRDALQAACNYIDTLGGVSTGYRAALSQPAPLAGEVTREQIESCALAAGFSIEPSTGAIWAVDGYVGTRVDPGLRKFARAILALRPQAVPMTDELAPFDPCKSCTVNPAYCASCYHGITAKAEGGA